MLKRSKGQDIYDNITKGQDIYDNITTEILQNIEKIGVKMLMEFYNNLEKGKIAKDWKMEILIPVFQKEDSKQF